MKNIKLILEYDGTNYAGWQRQDNAITIQQVIEDALARATGEKISVTGSGRTDSGVHARGQTANFLTESRIPPERFSYVLNSMLPGDIRVLRSEQADMDFSARFSSVGKRYRYSMIVNQSGTAIGRQYCWHIRVPLDIEAMREAAGYFVGTYNFSAFLAAGSAVKTTVRTIYEANIDWSDPYLDFTVRGNGFLYNMVRIMTGTLVYVGMGKLKPRDIIDIIASGDRKKAGPTAPPHGLFLEEVYY